MKYVIGTFSVMLISIYAMDSDTIQLHYMPDTPHLPLISKHYKMAQKSVAHKNIDSLKKIAPELTPKEQIELRKLAQYELNNAPSTLQSFTKNGLRFFWGVGITAAGSLDFLLNYASRKVDDTCHDVCDKITDEYPVSNDPKACDKICSTISQDTLHVMAVPAGTTLITTGLVLSGYSLYSFITEWKNKSKLQSMITILQTSDHNSDDETALNTISTSSESDDSDSIETV